MVCVFIKKTPQVAVKCPAECGNPYQAEETTTDPNTGVTTTALATKYGYPQADNFKAGKCTGNFPLRYLQKTHPAVKIHCVDQMDDMKGSVLDKTAAAAVYDVDVLKRLIKASGDCKLKLVGELFGPQEYGYAFPKNSPLTQDFSEAILYQRDEHVHAQHYPEFFEVRYFKIFFDFSVILNDLSIRSNRISFTKNTPKHKNPTKKTK
jgi:hypothetical protein